MLAAFLWKRATKEGAVASIMTGASITIIWTYFIPNWSGFNNLNPFLQELTYPAAGLSILVLIIVSLFTPPPKKEVYEQLLNPTPVIRYYFLSNLSTKSTKGGKK